MFAASGTPAKEGKGDHGSVSAASTLLVARAPVAADSYGADSFGSCLAYAGGSAAACEVLLEAKVAVFVLSGSLVSPGAVRRQQIQSSGMF